MGLGFEIRVRVGFWDRTPSWVLVPGGPGVGFLDKGRVWVLGPGRGSGFRTIVGFKFWDRGLVSNRVRDWVSVPGIEVWFLDKVGFKFEF